MSANPKPYEPPKRVQSTEGRVFNCHECGNLVVMTNGVLYNERGGRHVPLCSDLYSAPARVGLSRGAEPANLLTPEKRKIFDAAKPYWDAQGKPYQDAIEASTRVGDTSIRMNARGAKPETLPSDPTALLWLPVTDADVVRLREIAAYLDTAEVAATEDATFLLALNERVVPMPPRGEAETPTDTHPLSSVMVPLGGRTPLNELPIAPHRHSCVEAFSDGYRCKVRGHCLCECGARQATLTDTWITPDTANAD